MRSICPLENIDCDCFKKKNDFEYLLLFKIEQKS